MTSRIVVTCLKKKTHAAFHRKRKEITPLSGLSGKLKIVMIEFLQDKREALTPMQRARGITSNEPTAPWLAQRCKTEC